MDNTINIFVENFGSVKESQKIEIKPFMVFSGQSGLGKSYTSLLVHYVYRIVTGEELKAFFTSLEADYDELKKLQPEEETIIFRFGIEHFKEWVDKSALTYMRNTLGNPAFDAKIHIDFSGMNETFNYYFRSNSIKAEGETIEYYESIKFIDERFSLTLSKESGKWFNIPFVLLFSKYLRNLYEITPGATFFMPPSRGALVALPDSERLNLQKSMGMYQEFLDGLSRLKASPEQESGYIRTMASNLLHGEIKVKDNEMVYVMSDADGEIPITAAASSVKELAPFSLMIQKGLLGRYSILFEEPESHLHPQMQIQVADLLACALMSKSHIQITLHSDYLLRRLNDLIRLHILKEKMNDEKQFGTYCKEHGFSPSVTIDPRIVGAYFFERTDKGVCIKPQKVSSSIPFDTFNEVFREQLQNSAHLYDTVEELL